MKLVQHRIVFRSSPAGRAGVPENERLEQAARQLLERRQELKQNHDKDDEPDFQHCEKDDDDSDVCGSDIQVMKTLPGGGSGRPYFLSGS